MNESISVTRRVVDIGNSRGIILPKTWLDHHNAQDEAFVKITLGEKLIVEFRRDVEEAGIADGQQDC